MLDLIKPKQLFAFYSLVAASPCLGSMYFLYWLQKNEIWTSEISFRDIMTIAIVVLGMGASLLVHTFIRKRRE